MHLPPSPYNPLRHGLRAKITQAIIPQPLISNSSFLLTPFLASHHSHPITGEIQPYLPKRPALLFYVNVNVVTLYPTSSSPITDRDRRPNQWKAECQPVLRLSLGAARLAHPERLGREGYPAACAQGDSLRPCLPRLPFQSRLLASPPLQPRHPQPVSSLRLAYCWRAHSVLFRMVTVSSPYRHRMVTVWFRYVSRGVPASGFSPRSPPSPP